MARIRTIKPEFWTDEKIVELSPLARLLFIGLWNFADDEGRMEYRPLRFKLQILPADDADISALLGEIRGKSLIEVYGVDNKEFLQIVGFAKHQKVDKRSGSKLPPPPISAESPRIVPTDQGRDQGSGIKDQGREDSPQPPSSERDDCEQAFDAWNRLAGEKGLAKAQRLTDSRRRKLRQRLAECGGMDGWMAAMERIRGSPFLLGENDRGWRADLDFVLQQSSFTKLMEGAYDRSKPASALDYTDPSNWLGEDDAGPVPASGDGAAGGGVRHAPSPGLERVSPEATALVAGVKRL